MRGAADVAPRVGAWVEIMTELIEYNQYLSLPAWERGLKFSTLSVYIQRERSLPAWERGLKYHTT